MSALTYGSGAAGTISYDTQYRITDINIVHPASGIMHLSYPTYDNNGNIQAIQDQLDPTKNRSFTYDALDRLDIANGPWGSLDWGYDGAGNRLTENSTVYTYYSGTNRLSGAGGTSFNYDNNGNTTTETSRSYTYNQNQRLIQAVSGGTTANYTYNGNGQRVKKVVGGTTTVFHYSLSGQIIAESNSAGTITAEYVYLNGQPLAKIEGANTYHYHNDHLGTPQKMTDSTGTVVWAADYKPFGEATITVSTITNNLRFPGQYYDAETGLNYNYFRDYNSIIGRFIERDPIGLKGGINLYRYVKNNPLKYKDPRGLVWVYDQSTGTMVHVDDQTGVGTFAGDGYSGNGVGLNNPAEQGTPNVGPIPQGTYDIGQGYNHDTLGPNTMNLDPRQGTDTLGRDAFRIHGDNRQGNNSASEGCIIQNRNTRDQINNSNDRVLEVIQ